MEEGERRGSTGEDRISGLPDELLHDILVRLRSAQAAARTSVLSRRWRHFWAHLPALHFVAPRAAASFLDAVDGALAGYQAPTLGHLSISLMQRDVPISVLQSDVSTTIGRVAPWLQFAADHMAAEFDLYLLPNPTRVSPSPPLFFEANDKDERLLELPAWESAKRIDLSLTRLWRVRPQATGLFTSLTSLKISDARMGGAELTALVCTQCPCLRDLALYMELIAVSDISVHSNSLHSLVFQVRNTRRLEVMAPELEQLTVRWHPMEAHISASKLVMLVWRSAYEPHLHRFADVGRSLRLLDTSHGSVLTKQFDEVDELKLRINIQSVGVTGYETFLNETNKLPKCKSMEIYLLRDNHALLPSVLQLLRNCSSTKKLSLVLEDTWSLPSYSCPASCPCGLEESHHIDGVALSSLEEVEISEFTDSDESMELVEFLTRNAAILKRLVINYTMSPDAPLTKKICEKIRSMCHGNVEVKFHVFRDMKLVPFD